MSRLIAFGDSYTYGYGLDDSSSPSVLAWPTILGKRLNLQVINKAQPGASNLEILTNILAFSYEPDDLVVVGWTYISRDLIFNKSSAGRFSPNGHKQISIWDNDAMSQKWSDLHNDYDLAIRSGLYINHADLFLEDKKLNYHFFIAEPKKIRPLWLHNSFLPKCIYKTKATLHTELLLKLDIAKDGMHPGVNSQAKLADNLYNIIYDK